MEWQFNTRAGGKYMTDAPAGMCELNEVEGILTVECSNNEDVALNLTYEVLDDEDKVFEMNAVVSPEFAIWTVKIDGIEFKEFTRVGAYIIIGAVHFKERLNSEVIIEASSIVPTDSLN